MRKYKGVKSGGGNELQPYNHEGKYGNDDALTELILQLSSSPQKALEAYLDYNSIRITQHCAERINERGIGPGDILRTLMARLRPLKAVLTKDWDAL